MNRASMVAKMEKNLPATWENRVWSLGGSLLPWRRAWQPTPVFLPGESPWTEESGRLQAMGLQRVRHDWATKHTHRWTAGCRHQGKAHGKGHTHRWTAGCRYQGKAHGRGTEIPHPFHRWTAGCRCQGKARGRAQRSHTLSRHVFSQHFRIHQCQRSPNPVLRKFSWKPSTHSHDQSLTESLVPLDFPEDGRWGRKSQTYNHGLVFLVPRLHTEGTQEPTKRCVIRTKDILGNFKGFRHS